MKQTYTTRLEVELIEKLKEVAFKEGVSACDVISKALSKYLGVKK